MKSSVKFCNSLIAMAFLLLLAGACSKEKMNDVNIEQTRSTEKLDLTVNESVSFEGTEIQTPCGCTFTLDDFTPGTTWAITMPGGVQVNPVTPRSASFNVGGDQTGFSIQFSGKFGASIDLTYTIDCGGELFTSTITVTDGTTLENPDIDVYFILDDDCNIVSADGCRCVFTVTDFRWLVTPIFSTDPLTIPEFSRVWRVNTPNPGAFNLAGSVNRAGQLIGNVTDVFYANNSSSFEITLTAGFPAVFNSYEAVMEFTLDCGSNQIDKFTIIQQDPVDILRGQQTFRFNLEEDCSVAIDGSLL